ncbi:biotin--[acetyl-CoA-carboxylase] ligase [Bifidobacterium boum]|uniref:biotin--[acetyl-CoA-carboxylase] ligase n=1 Tax=Bifidobacterium boum TaxID=78343 RepID=UPI00242C1B61|nr:biotin--[acetyl-CoA-carboxylase] ligase [Bifidobacterium boum]MCI5861303.1 biotin--[acetyl-CoA-carboxylase] ligase [Bifidobacterium boum]
MMTKQGTIPRMPRTEQEADRLITLAEVDSTNVLAGEMLKDGRIGGDPADDGKIVVIAADYQTGGHGRLGRAWVNRPGESFTVSFVTVMPADVVADETVNGWLPTLAGLASRDAIRSAVLSSGARPRQQDCTLSIKWPNDIFCHGLKLGGILVQLVPLDARRTSVIIGIGINLALRAESLPTPQSTSLQLHVESLPDTQVLRDRIAADLVSGLRERIARFVDDRTTYAAQLLEETRQVSWTLGRRAEAKLVGGETIIGRAVRINPDASLAIVDDEGVEHTITTGDVGVLD